MLSVIQILIATYISQGGPLAPLPEHLQQTKGAKEFDASAAYLGGGSSAPRYRGYTAEAFANLPVGCAADQPENCRAWEVPAQTGAQYAAANTLVALVIVLIPVMLCVVPCCFRPKGTQVDEDTLIEMAEGGPADRARPYLAVAINEGSDDHVEAAQIDLVHRRTSEVSELKSILKRLGTPVEGSTFFGAFIHQMIETIEFVLGTVSNTASYLRLWALSLAHGQLGEVFFNLTMNNPTLKSAGAEVVFSAKGIGKTIWLCFIFWPAFWSVTFAVLMCMDCLECVLHTLRLHWVEFQNKFFKGDGYQFRPFSHKE